MFSVFSVVKKSVFFIVTKLEIGNELNYFIVSILQPISLIKSQEIDVIDHEAGALERGK